jgi:AraC family transcriptional regulator
MIRSDLVNKSIDYIIRHLEEEISIEDVAAHCNYSKFYFSKIFKEETGESIYAFIKRLRLDQSAIELKLDKNRPIMDIGLDYGYSSSNYSSAFKKHHAVSPAEFRKDLNQEFAHNPYEPEKSVRFLTFAEYDQKIEIQHFPEFTVIHERHIGSYLELGSNWIQFTEKHKEYHSEDTLLMERFYDDPSITGIEQCIYDLFMTVDQNCPLDRMKIPGGKFAVYRFEGSVDEIFSAFQGVFRTWLPDSRYQMTERYGLDIYRSIDWETLQVVVDLCIPVK